MSDLYQTSAELRAGVADLARQERPGAALTLTRSALQAITTAGTLVTWQTETRNQGFTWATTDITMPTSGYYAVQTFFCTSNNVTFFTQRFVNGTNVGYFGNSWTATNYHVAAMVRYFVTGDVLQIRVIPSVNGNITVIAENSTNEAPLLHIVQLTGVI
jgi:hypothetical protein